MNSTSLGEILKALARRAMALLIVCGFAFDVVRMGRTSADELLQRGVGCGASLATG